MITVNITIKITISIIITSNIDVDKVILRLYEGVKGNHLEVENEQTIVDAEEE